MEQDAWQEQEERDPASFQASKERKKERKKPESFFYGWCGTLLSFLSFFLCLETQQHTYIHNNPNIHTLLDGAKGNN
jgi:hypothetical protein